MSDKLRILNHMETIGPITPMEAMKLYGCYRLSARIHELRASGEDIITDMVESTDRYGERSRHASYRINRKEFTK